MVGLRSSFTPSARHERLHPFGGTFDVQWAHPSWTSPGGRVGRNVIWNSSPYTKGRGGRGREARAQGGDEDVESVCSTLRMKMWSVWRPPKAVAGLAVFSAAWSSLPCLKRGVALYYYNATRCTFHVSTQHTHNMYICIDIRILLETLPVHNAGPTLIVLSLGNPHTL